MNYNNQRSQQIPGIIRYSCSLLFLLFCFCYIFFMQGELLSEAQYVYSHGITHYDNLVGALIITASVQLLQLLVAWLTKVPASFHALTYFPSFLCLAALTDLSRERFSDETFAPWTWMLPLLFVCWVCLVLILKRVRYASIHQQTADTLASILWPNYLILFVLMLFCGLTNKADDVWFYELKTERLILERRYAEAAQVGIEADATSPRLNNLRHFALSQMGQGRLPDQMFLYPQPYGIDGLLVLSDTVSRRERLTVADITARLGVHTAALDMPVGRFLLEGLHLQQAHLDSLCSLDSITLATMPDSIRQQHAQVVSALRRQVSVMADYRLCALLLDKNLPQFVDEISRYYPAVADSVDDIRAALPRAYREALAIIAPQWTDSATLQRYYDYAAMVDTLSTPRQRRNLTLYEQGRTYWWYFDFQE